MTLLIWAESVSKPCSTLRSRLKNAIKHEAGAGKAKPQEATPQRAMIVCFVVVAHEDTPLPGRKIWESIKLFKRRTTKGRFDKSIAQMQATKGRVDQSVLRLLNIKGLVTETDALAPISTADSFARVSNSRL